MLNALAGVVSTIANVFGVKHGHFSTTAKITIIVTGATCVVCGVLNLLYSFWFLRRVKNSHIREIGKEEAGKHGEGVLGQAEVKATEEDGGV